MNAFAFLQCVEVPCSERLSVSLNGFTSSSRTSIPILCAGAMNGNGIVYRLDGLHLVTGAQ